MKLARKIGVGLVAGVALAAVSMPMASDAEAGVVTYSSLEISNLRITSGLEGIVTGGNRAPQFTNSTRTNASFNDAPGVSNSSPTDAQMSCVGNCGGIGQNDYSQVSAGAGSDWQFARGDAQLGGNLLQPGGASGSTVGEMNLNQRFTAGTGGSEAGTNAAVWSMDFETDAAISDVTLEFDAIGELLALSDNEFGSGQASYNWVMTIRNADTNSFVDEFAPGELNQNVAVLNEGGIDSYSVNQSFLFTVGGLQQDTRYRVIIDHKSDVNAQLVSAPATLAVLGLGLLGLGAVARRRRQVA